MRIIYSNSRLIWIFEIRRCYKKLCVINFPFHLFLSICADVVESVFISFWNLDRTAERPLVRRERVWRRNIHHSWKWFSSTLHPHIPNFLQVTIARQEEKKIGSVLVPQTPTLPFNFRIWLQALKKMEIIIIIEQVFLFSLSLQI